LVVVVHGSGHGVGCWDAVLADLTTSEQNAKVFTESFGRGSCHTEREMVVAVHATEFVVGKQSLLRSE
jgi:hypothetical protein